MGFLSSQRTNFYACADTDMFAVVPDRRRKTDIQIQRICKPDDRRDHVFHNFSKNIRRDLRAAEKKLHITFEYSADILYPMIEKTFSEQRRKSPIAKEMVERILQNAREHHGGKMISAVDDEGNIHASAFFLYDQRRCYYLAGGKDTDYKNSNGLTLVIWEGIKFASTVSEVFDFEEGSQWYIIR